MRGIYIAIEGIDGSGKSRLVQGLVSSLREKGEVLLVREPHLPGTRALFRRGLPPLAEFFLFNADRHVLFREVVNPALGRGSLVVADRSFLSSLAYQAPLLPWGVERTLELCLEATEGTRPHIWFLLDLPVEEAWRRARGRAEGEEDFLRERLEGVRRRYLELAEEEGGWVLDAQRPFGEILDEALRLLERRGFVKEAP